MHSQPQHSRITQISVVDATLESGFWEVTGEPRGGYSRLRDQASV